MRRLTLLATLLVLTVAPAAQAGQASMSGSGLFVNLTADADDATVLRLRLVEGGPPAGGVEWEASITEGTLSPGAGCRAAGTLAVRCPRTSNGVRILMGEGADRFEPAANGLTFPDVVVADMGSENDTYTGFDFTTDSVIGGAGGDVLDGNGGDDDLDGGDDPDTLRPDAGSDVTFGGAANDVIIEELPGESAADPGADDDQHAGGSGTDTITYALRQNPIVLLFGEDGGSGGEIGSGEGDGVKGFERFIGTRGNDRLNSGFASVPVFFSGQAGDDLLIGSNGDDQLRGGLGLDTLKGDEGDDTIDGKAEEVVNGTPTAFADPVIDCGPGSDLALIDLRDYASPTACESVNRAPAGEEPEVSLPARELRLRRAGGEARVKLACPRSAKDGCEGKVRLGKGERRFPARAFALARGAKRKVAVPAPFRGRGFVETEEEGSIGPKTLTRVVRVR
jgi:Ca2+-binding RTX toxin-like protein